MKALLTAFTALLPFLSTLAANEESKHTGLSIVSMQLTPLNPAAKAIVGEEPLQALGACHEGQGFAIGLNGLPLRIVDEGETAPHEHSTLVNLQVVPEGRAGDDQSFEVTLKRVFSADGKPLSTDRMYLWNEVVFAEEVVKGTIKPMRSFRKNLELANGEKYEISISMSPFHYPIWNKPNSD